MGPIQTAANHPEYMLKNVERGGGQVRGKETQEQEEMVVKETVQERGQKKK